MECVLWLLAWKSYPIYSTTVGKGKRFFLQRQEIATCCYETPWSSNFSNIVCLCYLLTLYVTLVCHIRERENEVAQSCLTLCDPMDGSLLGSSVHGIFQAKVLEWAAISFSRGSSWPRDQTQVYLHCRQTLYPLKNFPNIFFLPVSWLILSFLFQLFSFFFTQAFQGFSTFIEWSSFKVDRMKMKIVYFQIAYELSETYIH